MALRNDLIHFEDDPHWYRDAIIYELHVRAFHDSNDDGMGDFRGLSQKLDYLQDLGVTALWLLPFSPSPWRDDGYDIGDYADVHPAYGTLRDFHSFLKEAHRRGLRVITEVVVNHTSDQHEWFQRSRRAAPGSKWRDFYVWSDTPDKYQDARIIFKDFESSNWTWDPVAKAYYWHRFYSHQPDLNFDSPHVRQAVLDVVDFWFDMGVDAFRLDAIPYLYEREGTNCENLPETHQFLKQLRAHVDLKYRSRMLLAEANQWPEDAVAYFGNGDECNMCFHFPVMPRMFMAIRMEDRYPIIEILQVTPHIPDNCQWAIFLRNHDELTLEMVTDEERDYMYRVYAHDQQMRINLGIRRRLAPLLGNDRRRIELMNALLFSLPGTPVLYYGDEIGMGDNIYLGDRNGVRTPMQWSADRNAGFSRSSPQRLYLPITSDPEYHYETINVEAQQNNANSLLWWMKRIIEQRKQFKAFGRGTITFLHPENRKVLAFVRQYENESILVVANLSRFPQYVELDLSQYKGSTPVEVFGRVQFPPVGDQPYVITLGSHGFYWLSLEHVRVRQETIEVTDGRAAIPLVPVETWDRLLEEKTINGLIRLLPRFLQTRRWFRSKARTLRAARVQDIVPIPDSNSYVVLIVIDYSEGDPESYILPVSVARGEEVLQVETEHADTIVARLRANDGSEGVLYGALWNKAFRDALLGSIARRRRLRGQNGEMLGSHTRTFRRVWGASHPNLESTLSRAEQSNSSIIYGDRFILKLFRKVEPGTNPDLEISGFLAEREFPNTPPLTGHIEYRPHRGQPMYFGILHAFVPNQGDAWMYTLDELSRFFENALASPEEERTPAVQREHPLLLMNEEVPGRARELVGTYLESARLLGQRTAEMHIALSDPKADESFLPEPFTDHYRQGLYHGMIAQANRSLQLLRRRLPHLTEAAAVDGRQVLELEEQVRNRFRPLRDQRIQGVRIRHHGDFHLGQVLYTGKDFMVIDFEGEPARPMSERRLKRSPLRDVAGMIRSFQYAAYAALYGRIAGVTQRPEMLPVLEQWAAYWNSWVSTVYVKGYLDKVGKAVFLPPTAGELRTLLDVYTLEKALYEISYELNNRPDWVRIPLNGILRLLSAERT
jgi:maltose alpha-D-glucosyltransferase/alpha-amylase